VSRCSFSGKKPHPQTGENKKEKNETHGWEQDKDYQKKGRSYLSVHLSKFILGD
jgi:hypothetical protein